MHNGCAFLTEKKVITPRVRFSLSDHALLMLAVKVRFHTEFHGRRLEPHAAAEALQAEEDQHLATALIKRLERRREAATFSATLQLADWNKLSYSYPSKLAGIERVNETVNRFEAAISALDDVVPLLTPYLIPPRYVNWHDHAVELAQDFRRHLRECNPSRQFGISEKGPVVGFVTAVIPLITGENPDEGAVYKYLIRHIGPKS
jgi:hypothetical protein